MAANNIEEQAFLGTGWSFPPSFNKRKQSVEMLSGVDDIQSSLRILMTTSLGERSLRSKYGSKVADMVFEPIDNTQRAVLRSHIMDAIYLHEPRIRPLDVTVDLDTLNGKVEIEIQYKVVATNTRRNFVFPFYLTEGTEVNIR